MSTGKLEEEPNDLKGGNDLAYKMTEWYAATHATVFSICTICSSFLKNHLSILVSSQSLWTEKPECIALAMAKIRLSEGLVSS